MKRSLLVFVSLFLSVHSRLLPGPTLVSVTGPAPRFPCLSRASAFQRSDRELLSDTHLFFIASFQQLSGSAIGFHEFRADHGNCQGVSVRSKVDPNLAVQQIWAAWVRVMGPDAKNATFAFFTDENGSARINQAPCAEDRCFVELPQIRVEGQELKVIPGKYVLGVNYVDPDTRRRTIKLQAFVFR